MESIISTALPFIGFITAFIVLITAFIGFITEKRKNKNLEKPLDTTEKVTYHVQITINTNGNQINIGENQIHSPPQKNIALPSLSNESNDESKISYLIKKLYKDINSVIVYEDIRLLTLSLLEEFGNEIPNLFSDNEYAEILEFLQNISFKNRIKNILLKLFTDAKLTENERYNAGLFCIYLIKEDSIKLFISEDWNKVSHNKIDEIDVVEYLFNLINIGFTFYNFDYSFDNQNCKEEFNSKFKEIFSTTIEEITFRLIRSENNSIVWAASWAFVWIINAKDEKQNIQYSWSSHDKVYEILLDEFSKARQIEIIKLLMFAIHKLNIEKCAFKNNFIYECAFCIDNEIEIVAESVEPINIDITKLIYSKYLMSDEPVQNILAEYLAKYGHCETTIATRLLSTNLSKLNPDFVSFVLIPYVNQINDVGIVSFVIEWLNSNDDKIKLYGSLLKKSIERNMKKVIDFLKGGFK